MVGGIVWITGISGAGKSTLAEALGQGLRKILPAVVLDEDDLRHELWPEVGFSILDRKRSIQRLSYLAAHLAQSECWVLVAAVSPYREDRRDVRMKAKVAGVGFCEVYLHCSPAAAEQRDKKGFHIDAPYEASEHPEVMVDTSSISREETARQVFRHLIGIL